MNKQNQLNGLAEITQAEFDLAQLELAKSYAREAELRAALTGLKNSLSSRANTTLDETDTAFIAGADMNWQIWVEQRRRFINIELAKCLAHQDKCREVAKRGFGRQQAVLSLAKLNKASRKRAIARKSDYTS